MPFETNKQYCCCFTGHREDRLHRPEKEVLGDLNREISQAIEDGFTTFITGMAYGVDIWAGELVLEQRKKHREIQLIAAIPFEGFETRWSESWKRRYRKLIRKADDVNYICKDYSKIAYQMRNEWMVDRASRVIAVYNGEPSGTRNTINYAKKVDVPIVFIQG